MFSYFDKLFFNSLINEINSKGINYCIVGDYKSLPDYINHDLDFWTDDPEGFYASVQKIANETGFKFLLINGNSNGFNIVLFKKVEENICIIKIDVFNECSYKSFLTLAHGNLFKEHRRIFNGFFVADEEVEALVHFLYPLLEWGKIKGKYKTDIKLHYQSRFFETAIKNLFGTRNGLLIISYIENNNWDKIECIIPQLKRIAVLRFLFKYDLKQFKKIYLVVYYNFRRLIKPSGFSIAFCGLDGAGKTTLIILLKNLFVSVFKEKKVFVGYWRPYILPELRELFWNLNSKKPRLISERKPDLEIKPKGLLISLLKLVYYSYDYLLGKIKFFNIHNKGGFVLFDRHYLDMIIHPQRFEMNLPKSILRFFYQLTPKNDLTFFFWATPEIIHSRKVEFSKDEIKVQTQAYLSEGKRIKNFIPIETNKPLVEEIEEILTAISTTRFHAKR